MNEKIQKEEDKKEEIDFDCPEEMHYFMVNLTINYKNLKIYIKIKNNENARNNSSTYIFLWRWSSSL
jgi:hypothetical protein